MIKMKFYSLPLLCHEIGWYHVTSVRQTGYAAQVVNEAGNCFGLANWNLWTIVSRAVFSYKE